MTTIEIPQNVAANVEQRFSQLVEEWQQETQFTSSLTEMVLHPAYQQIIGLGPAAIPLLLRELRERPDHWFWALFSITGENPVQPEEEGDLPKMTRAWLEFGKRQGYV